jgi:protein-arginine kinase activator protein McsA
MTSKLTPKQRRKLRDGEMSMCPNCYCMTKSILIKNKLKCGKCGGYK